MALHFHFPSHLQGRTPVVTEAWPPLKRFIVSPWTDRGHRTFSTPPPARSKESQQFSGGVGQASPAATIPVLDAFRPTPVFARSPPISRRVAPQADVRRNPWFTPSNGLISAASPLGRGLLPPCTSPRPFSLARYFTTLRQPRHGFGAPSRMMQRRGLYGQSPSQNLLAHLEQTANNNTQSATAQNAFYQALLKADMPQIVVERYQTGRYATNAAGDAAYLRALERVGQTEKAHPLMGSPSLGNPSVASDVQLQAISQAIAARTHGANIALSRSKAGAATTGAKDAPLYVVVEQTIGDAIFKWVKFILYFVLVGYLSLVVVTIAIEMSGILRRVGGTQNEAQAQHQTVRFSDVHGCDEAKEELQELVEFLKAPEKFSNLGGKLPKGVLLVGPPGTGKTLLARAVAGEAGVPFFFMAGSEFDEVYVGVGAKRVRDLFTSARAKAPAIVFIDELDAIGGKRNERDAAYAKQTLNQLLTELDGFSQSQGVIILAATNFPQMLDKALTRPGRFDRNVVVPLPDVRGRIAILNHHLKKIQAATDVDAAVLARGTPGFSGAELENVVNQAAVHASRNQAPKVAMTDFEWAKDKILMGAERRSAVIQQKDKLMTAYHEGGHALVALFTHGADPLYKATIMPRGQSLGVTFQLPELDKVSMAKKEILARIDVCMAGKVAEELVYGPDEVTTGASNDIQQATRLAFQMVTQAGMSESIGNVDMKTDYDHLSSATKQRIEGEVRRIIEEGRERATKLLTSRRGDLDTIAKALLEYETLNKDEIETVLRGEKLPDRLTSLASAPIKLPDVLLAPGRTGGVADVPVDGVARVAGERGGSTTTTTNHAAPTANVGPAPSTVSRRAPPPAPDGGENPI
ncbi:MAG: hypothetical protein M1826_000704 [Phylliscum demangeonii]|nr:MAG: hypothetical protein M1826_000704 [Phylliscum demangeonii]